MVVCGIYTQNHLVLVLKKRKEKRDGVFCKPS